MRGLAAIAAREHLQHGIPVVQRGVYVARFLHRHRGGQPAWRGQSGGSARYRQEDDRLQRYDLLRARRAACRRLRPDP